MDKNNNHVESEDEEQVEMDDKQRVIAHNDPPMMFHMPPNPWIYNNNPVINQPDPELQPDHPGYYGVTDVRMCIWRRQHLKHKARIENTIVDEEDAGDSMWFVRLPTAPKKGREVAFNSSMPGDENCRVVKHVPGLPGPSGTANKEHFELQEGAFCRRARKEDRLRRVEQRRMLPPRCRKGLFSENNLRRSRRRAVVQQRAGEPDDVCVEVGSKGQLSLSVSAGCDHAPSGDIGWEKQGDHTGEEVENSDEDLGAGLEDGNEDENSD